MDAARREQLNIVAIRVSLSSAMRGLPAAQAERTLSRANLLLDQARREATSPAVLRDIEDLQLDLDRRAGLSGRGETSG